MSELVLITVCCDWDEHLVTAPHHLLLRLWGSNSTSFVARRRPRYHRWGQFSGPPKKWINNWMVKQKLGFVSIFTMNQSQFEISMKQPTRLTRSTIFFLSYMGTFTRVIDCVTYSEHTPKSIAAQFSVNLNNSTWKSTNSAAVNCPNWINPTAAVNSSTEDGLESGNDY